jgi:hypothetical protein
MASATTKKTCAKCGKGAGTATCNGCEQSFCTKHFIEHRQELSQQMDNIGQEHDVLCRDLTNEQGTHPLIKCINEWEQESITKIQVAAEVARADLQQLLNKAKNNLKTSVTKMTEELQSSRESDDYTEVDIRRWINQLQELRMMLDSPLTINIDYENNTRSLIRLIKVSNKQSSGSLYQVSQSHELNNRISSNLETTVSERFTDIFGKITLSEDGFVATCVNGYGGISYVGGIGRYSSGTHCIRFRIEKRSPIWLVFLGIVSESEKMTNDILHTISCHGWWDIDSSVVGGKANSRMSIRIIEIGDEVTLVLDCNNRRIQLEHHRTNSIVNMPIDLQLCAFPWKIIVLLRSKDDCVRIIH